MDLRSTTIMLLLCPSLAVATTASAQSTGPLPASVDDPYALDRLSVLARESALNPADGIRTGSIVIRPQFTLPASFTDNVFATDANKVSDVVFTPRVEVAAATDFSRNRLSGRAYFERQLFVSTQSESVSRYGVNMRGSYDIDTATRASANASFDRLSESRGALSSNRQTNRPNTYRTLAADINLARTYGPGETTIIAAVRSYSYDDAPIGSVLTSQRFRDFVTYIGAIDTTYEVRNLTTFVVHGEVERREYAIRQGSSAFTPLTLFDRSATGFRVEAGIQRDISRLISGTIRVGYLRYNYADPRIRAVNSTSYHADIGWQVTPLTSVQVAADRTLDETLSPQTSGNLRDSVTAAAQHEFLRRLIGIADVRYDNVRPIGPDPKVQELRVGIGARYYIGRMIVLGARIDHAQRSSNDATIAYQQNRATVSVVLRK